MFGATLNANGENPKVIQKLLRHANLKVTMDSYALEGLTGTVIGRLMDARKILSCAIADALFPGSVVGCLIGRFE